MNVKDVPRTLCSCEICRLNCKVIPGYLIPDDILNICKFLGMECNVFNFSFKYLLSSPGALVSKGGNQFRIPTLVPKRNPDTNYCIFLDKNELCKIHKVAPYGCAKFDCKQTYEEANEISKVGLLEIINSDTKSLLYKLLHDNLKEKGHISKAPEELRKEFLNVST